MTGNQSPFPFQKCVLGILNWNGEKILPGCLDALSKYLPPAVKVWVIDNNSTDDSLKILKQDYPGVQVLKLEKNYGFAKAYNFFFQEVVRAGDYDYLAILNNDILIQEQWLESLLDVMLSRPRVAAVSSLLYLEDRKTLQNCGLTLHRWGACDSRFLGKEEKEVSLKVQPVFGFCGGAALLSVKALEKCGFFDERYFAYYEDADLSMRWQLAGYEIYFTPQARAQHLHSYSTGAHPARKLFLLEKNRWLFLFKFFPWRYLFYFLGPGFKTLYARKKKSPLLRGARREKGKGWGTLLRAYTEALCQLPSLRKSRRKDLLRCSSSRKIEDIFEEFAEF